MDPAGRLLLGPRTDLVHEAADPFAWALAPAGGALWLGTGGSGRVVRVEADGRAATVFEAAASAVQALVDGGAGRLYAATSPNGRVVALAPDGAASDIFTPSEPYIWALAVDAGGALLVGTGNPGRIYRVTPAGEASLLYDTRATHVLALAVDAEGRVLAGTGSPGRVLRIDPRGKAFVLLAADQDEITALRVASDGAVYAAAAAGNRPAAPPAAPPPAGREPVPTVSVTTEVTAVVTTAGAAPVTAAAETTPAVGAAAGAVYRIAPDGVWDVVWRSSEDTPYDLAVDGPDGVLIGTGGRGKVFRVSGSPPRTVLLDAGARAAGDELRRRARRRPLLRHREPRPPLPAVGAARGRGPLPLRRARRRDRRHLGGHPLARADAGAEQRPALHPLGQHADPGRDLERLVGGLHGPRRHADSEPQGALPAVAGGAAARGRAGAARGCLAAGRGCFAGGRPVGAREHAVGERGCPGPAFGHHRLPAPQPPARGDRGHRAPARRGVPGDVRERPAAGRLRPRRPRRRGAGRRRPRERPVADARTQGVPQGTPDVHLDGPGRQPGPPPLRSPLSRRGCRRLAGVGGRPGRHHLHLGHVIRAGRDLRGAHRRDRRPVEPAGRGARGLARQHALRRRQHAARDRPRPGPTGRRRGRRHLHRHRHPFADPARRVRGRPRALADRPSRWTAFRTRGRSASRWPSRPNRPPG